MWRFVWAISHLSAALDGVGVLAYPYLVPGDGVGELISQLLYNLWGRDGALQRESPVPGREASGVCLGIVTGGDTHHKLCCTDHGQRGIYKDLQTGK